MTGKPLVPGRAAEAELSFWMQTYGPALTGLCAGLLGDLHLAQDVVQETFSRAYQRRDSFRGQYAGSEKAWLTRIAINLCRDQQRSKWFRLVDKRVPVEELNLPMPMADEEARQVFAAVRSLPSRYREIILLHYDQNLKINEIAQALGLSASSVYRRLDKARQLLKRTLEGWDDSE